MRETDLYSGKPVYIQYHRGNPSSTESFIIRRARGGKMCMYIYIDRFLFLHDMDMFIRSPAMYIAWMRYLHAMHSVSSPVKVFYLFIYLLQEKKKATFSPHIIQHVGDVTFKKKLAG